MVMQQESSCVRCTAGIVLITLIIFYIILGRKTKMKHRQIDAHRTKMEMGTYEVRQTEWF